MIDNTDLINILNRTILDLQSVVDDAWNDLPILEDNERIGTDITDVRANRVRAILQSGINQI